MLIFSAQEQALRTNYIKFHIDKTIDSPLCRMCGERGESVYHLVSECSKLAQREYNRRHDDVARYIHWQLCKNGDSKELVSGMNRNQKECLRMKTVSYYGISPYNVTE